MFESKQKYAERHKKHANCAKKWLRDKKHLNNCACLEEETKELCKLFINSLKEVEEKLKKCSCESSPKPRTPYYDWNNYGYTYCEKCEAKIKGAGKTGKIKNRNNPAFWGLKVKEKGAVWELPRKQKKNDMTPLRRAEFNRYRKVGRL